MAIVYAHKSHQLFLNVSFLLLLSFFITTHLSPFASPSTPLRLRTTHHPISPQQGCEPIESLKGYAAKCSYLETHAPCHPRAYIDYLHIFYCICGRHPSLGYALLALWLLVLFYLSANTASQYFCSSLEGLSRLLRLPPAVAGATLLALGNGAPDVFSSVISFAGSGTGEVGLSGILGGALFVSSVVVGVITICVSSRSVRVDRSSFIRDLCFFLAVLGSLLLILLVGTIGVLGSVCFASLYIAYVILVSVRHCSREKSGELVAPLLDSIAVEEPARDSVGGVENKLSYSKSNSSASIWFGRLLYLLEMPLYLPRRLTIPDVRAERWSKPFAAASVALSPVLLAALWSSERGEMGSEGSLIGFLSTGLLGLVLGIIALGTTEKSQPPKKCLLFWLAGGFLMSVAWAYIVTRELVALLVSMGHILRISPAVLGVTVLAWGNSLGDLVANVAMAVRGGQDGAQIAVSGCYAGPIFNTLVGLGLSLVLASWAAHPSPLVIPGDPAAVETLAFLVGALLWALVVLPSRGMRLDRVLGIGLLAIYLCFLCLRVSGSIGLV